MFIRFMVKSKNYLNFYSIEYFQISEVRLWPNISRLNFHKDRYKSWRKTKATLVPLVETGKAASAVYQIIFSYPDIINDLDDESDRPYLYPVCIKSSSILI